MDKHVDKALKIEVLDKITIFFTTTLLFISHSVVFYNQSRSVKKSKFLACARFIQYTKKYQKNFWTKQTWIVTFITTFWTFHSPPTKLFELAKDPTKSLLHSKCFIFAIQSNSSDLFSSKKLEFPGKKIESLLDSLGEFLKAFDQTNKVSQIPLPKPTFKIGYTQAKDERFTHCYRDIAEHLNRQFRYFGYRFGLKITKPAFFP